jgi:hypothetical protein
VDLAEFMQWQWITDRPEPTTCHLPRRNMKAIGHLAFGQPIDGIIQIAYLVENIDRAMPAYTELLGVGPWFKRGPLTADTARYRGEPTDVDVTIARGFTGHLMVEWIQQHKTRRRSTWRRSPESAMAFSTGASASKILTPTSPVSPPWGTRWCCPTRSASTRASMRPHWLGTERIR